MPSRYMRLTILLTAGVILVSGVIAAVATSNAADSRAGPSQAKVAEGGSPPAAPLGPGGPAPLTIELNGVPAELKLPAGQKHNYFMTAIIRGTVPAEVWLARSADAPFSVPIPAFGDGRYQLNLADDRTVLALRRTGGSGQCYVFAKTPDGRVVQSAAIRFELSGPTASFHAVRAGQSDWLNESVEWFRSEQVTHLKVSVDPSLPGLTAQAMAGGRTWPLASQGETAHTEAFALDVTPELRAAWGQAGQMDVRCSPPLHKPHFKTLKVIPARLALPADGLHVEARPDSTVEVPGSNGYLSFVVTNVGESGADVVLRRADERARAVRDPPVGVAQVFRLPEAQYVWVVDKTAPGPDGRRTATLRVCEGKVAESLVVYTVIGRIRGGSSSAALTFNGRNYDNDEAYKQLVELYKWSGEGTVAAFVEAIRARQKEKNSEAIITPPTAHSTSLPAWVLREVKTMGWEPLPADAATTQPAAVSFGD